MLTINRGGRGRKKESGIMATNVVEDEQGFIKGGGAALEAIPDRLDLHSDLATQVGILGSRSDYIAPLNTLEGAKTIEFQVASHLNELIDPLNTVIVMRCRCTYIDGALIPVQTQDAAGNAQQNPNKDVVPTNGTTYNLFKNCRVKLNDTQIAYGDNMYAHKADIETRLMWPASVKKEVLPMSGFFEESVAFDEIPHAQLNFNDPDNAGANATFPAFQERIKWSVASKPWEVMGKIHSPIFDQKKLLPPNTKLNIAFDLQDFDAFGVLSANNHGRQFKVKIEQCRLLVRYIKVDPDLCMEMIADANKGDPFRFSLRHVEMSFHTKPGAVGDISHPGLFKNGEVLPRRVFIAFVKNSAFRGSQGEDPFNYVDIGLRNYGLKLGGEYRPYPQVIQDTEENVTNSRLMSLFQLLGSTGCYMQEHTLGINLKNCRNRNNILAFDLTSSGTQPGETYELPVRTSCDLELQLRQALAQAHTMIVYAEYDAELQIHGNGTVVKRNFGKFT